MINRPRFSKTDFPEVGEAANNTLQIQPLNASHLPLINSSLNVEDLVWVQSLLWKSWLANLEGYLPNVLPARQPHCFIAIEQSTIVGLVVLSPFNRRGTCWLLQLPDLLNIPKCCSKRSVIKSLIEAAINYGSHRVKGWIFRCSLKDSDRLSVSREMGFQPLKFYQIWSSNKQGQTNKQYSDVEGSWNKDLEWNHINRNTAPLLWYLEQSGFSGHTRQITDRQWQDIMLKSDLNTKILTTKNSRISNALAGIISQSNEIDGTVIEIVRDVGWDSRISPAIISALRNIIDRSNNIKIRLDREDNHLNQIMDLNDWNESNQEILLGRSLWKRQINNKVIKGIKPIETVLGSFGPQHPPLPSPSTVNQELK